jgi:hypothetical protein
MSNLAGSFKAVYNKGLDVQALPAGDAETEQMLALLDFVTELKRGGLDVSLKKGYLSGASLIIGGLDEYKDRPFSVDAKIVKS